MLSWVYAVVGFMLFGKQFCDVVVQQMPLDVSRCLYMVLWPIRLILCWIACAYPHEDAMDELIYLRDAQDGANDSHSYLLDELQQARETIDRLNALVASMRAASPHGSTSSIDPENVSELSADDSWSDELNPDNASALSPYDI